MPFDGTSDDLVADFEILEAIGAIHEGLSERLVTTGAPQKTLRRWLVGHRDPPEDVESQIALMAAALDLELFTPSMSGKTAFDRHLDTRRPETRREQDACAALRTAQFRLVRIVGRNGPDLVRLQDLVTREDLVLLDSRISPIAAGAPTAMRLCRLMSGRHILISPLFTIDEAMLATAMGIVRPGKPLGAGHRCAANLYRDLARRGFAPMPTLVSPLDGEAGQDSPETRDDLTVVQDLARQWLETKGADEQSELTAEIRRRACLDNLVDACGWFASDVSDVTKDLRQAFAYIAEVQMETIDHRARAGVGSYAGVLDLAAEEIARHVAAGAMNMESRNLFERLKTRLSFSGATLEGASGSTSQAELDRVVQRILALRAKTVDHGCTEQEAMAAAAKVAELLDRYDLSLDEISVRKSDCAGAAVETRRRQGAPVDSCVQPVATFCDCRAWSEKTTSGTTRQVFFGLKADVEAAHFLYELIENTFETESGTFRSSDIYRPLQGGDRRTALNSFQIGLANGIGKKLNLIKSARQASAARPTGFDLVAVKHAILDEEIEKLGLRFTSRSASSPRRVHGDSYRAGDAAGAQFEPQASLSG